MAVHRPITSRGGGGGGSFSLKKDLFSGVGFKGGYTLVEVTAQQGMVVHHLF